jgi:CcmD family protein
VKDFNFLFGAYFTFFLMVFAYLWLISSRQKKLLREIEHLRRSFSSYRVDERINQA